MIVNKLAQFQLIQLICVGQYYINYKLLHMIGFIVWTKLPFNSELKTLILDMLFCTKQKILYNIYIYIAITVIVLKERLYAFIIRILWSFPVQILHRLIDSPQVHLMSSDKIIIIIIIIILNTNCSYKHWKDYFHFSLLGELQALQSFPILCLHIYQPDHYSLHLTSYSNPNMICGKVILW